MNKKAQADPRISSFMISLLLVGMVISILGLSLANINSKYSGTTQYNQSDIDIYNKLDELNEKTEDTKADVEKLKETKGAFDLIGSLFSNGWGAVKIAFQSFDIFDDILEASFKQTFLGNAGQVLRKGISGIIIIFIFIGVGISAILKWRT